MTTTVTAAGASESLTGGSPSRAARTGSPISAGSSAALCTAACALRSRFTGVAVGAGNAFQVELHRSGRIIEVPVDRTVLQAVRDVLPAVAFGCQQGICGACRTVVLAGEPDHRDELLTSTERAAGAMLICVSRARSERLTLDL